MGANIPLPALSVRPPEPGPDPLQQYARLQQLKNMGLQQQAEQQQVVAGQQENQIRAQQLKDAQAYSKALINWNTSEDPHGQDLMKSFINAGGSGNGALALQQHILERQKTLSQMAAEDATTGAKNLDTLKGKNDQVAGGIQGLLDMNDDDMRANLVPTAKRLMDNGMLDPQHAQAAAQLSQLPPDQLRQQLTTLKKSYMSDSQLMDWATKQADLKAKQAQQPGIEAEAQQKVRANAASQLAGATSQEQYAQLWGELPAKIARSFPAPEQWSPDSRDAILQGGMTPHEAATVPTERLEMKDWLAKNPGKGPADFLKFQKTIVPQFNFNIGNTGTVPAAGGGVDWNATAKRFGMSPEAMDQAAEKFYQTGQLPPIGRGNANAQALNKAIMNRTAELHPNQSLAAGSAEYKANSESLKRLQTMSDAVDSFENTASKNLDLFIEQAKKVVDTGSPWINKPLRTISEKALGNTDIPAYNAARQVAINEIAKVTSNPNLSAVLSDSARHEVENFNPENATLQQTLKVASILRQDMTNRKTSIADQIGAIKGRMSGSQQTQQQPTANQPLKITLPSGKIVTIGGQ